MMLLKGILKFHIFSLLKTKLEIRNKYFVIKEK